MQALLNSRTVNPDCSSCSELQFSILAEQMPDIIVCMDADARFSYANSRIHELTGHRADEFFGKTCQEVGLSERCSLLWAEIARDTFAKQTGVDRELQIEINGKMKVLHIRTVRDKLSSGKPSLIATVRDITGIRRDERHIHDLVQRLTYHMNNTPLAVMEWDPVGACLLWNGEAEDMFGWSRRHVKLGRVQCLDLVHPDDRPGFQILLERLKRGQVASDFVKCRTLHRDGSLIFCECHLSALLDAEGQAKSILWVANNVTDRVLAEQEMQQLNSGLSDRVRERTVELELSNDELQREILARKTLEAELISISEREHRRIGHDLHDGVCQELSGVRYSLEAMSKKRRKGTVLREQMDKLSGALERAVHHIRLLSRGLAPLELEGGNLAAALDELAANTSALFHVKCTVKCRGRNQRLEIEKAINLFRIAQEAIQNAIKHGDASHIRVDLDLLEGKLAITDNGNGIKDDDPAPPRGNGMGLKIMQHRADALQGTVAIERLPAGGVRVNCKFPK
jgi:PAS domain S-box-containing protein